MFHCNMPPRFNWHIVDSGVKHHNSKPPSLYTNVTGQDTKSKTIKQTKTWHWITSEVFVINNITFLSFNMWRVSETNATFVFGKGGEGGICDVHLFLLQIWKKKIISCISLNVDFSSFSWKRRLWVFSNTSDIYLIRI